MSREEIRKRLNPVPLGQGSFTVRSQLFSRPHLEALVTYVAGQ